MKEHFVTQSVGHETQDADIRPIVYTGIGLAITAVAVGIFVYGIFRYLGGHAVATIQSNPMSVEDQQIPPTPRLEEHPAIELQQLHADEDRMLSTYGWVDQKTGVVHIPIDRAMDLQLQRGFPTRNEAKK
jgi:hypothetical protein